ncbi:hypothetical protein H4K35_08710 [Myroides sp. NP-2]|uniref:hypothetical protein n=1 Tax=Myroides sp. NP-2 TaxID=2759945 RepID=UPI0015FA0593|nr:hypothetical protein [Myroides sp. NP-2]MBB1150209.1 hypothetical protein [Myroides sp. NP-2]
MKTVHIKIHFPYNLWQFRKIKLFENKNIIAKIISETEQTIQINDETATLVVAIDIYRSKIPIPLNQEEIFLIIYTNLYYGGLLRLTFDSLNLKRIRGRIVSQEVFENSTSTTIYQYVQEWLPIARLDKSILYIGLLTASITLFYSIYTQTEWREILFLLGGGTILSFLILLFEKDKVALGDYKNRMWATVGSFVLSILLIPAKDYVVQILILILTIGFTLRFIQHTQKLRTS